MASLYTTWQQDHFNVGRTFHSPRLKARPTNPVFAQRLQSALAHPVQTKRKPDAVTGRTSGNTLVTKYRTFDSFLDEQEAKRKAGTL